MSAASPPNTNGGGGESPQVDGATLDTTLLESLFYNEMMMLDDSSDLLSSVTGVTAQSLALPGKQAVSREASIGVSSTGSLAAAAKVGSPEDPLTFAEQSLLRDFGVTGSPIPHISDDSTSKADASKAPQDSSSHHPPQAPPPQPPQGWNNGQHAHYYPQHQNQDPNRFPTSQPPQYQSHHHHPGQQPYHPSSAHHPPPPHQQHAHHHPSYPQPHHPAPQQQQPYIQPRPAQPIVSKGIKHSVTPRQGSPGKQQSQAAPTQQTQQHSPIPNPLVQAYPPQPPAPHPSTVHHPQHPPPSHYPPPPQNSHTQHPSHLQQHPHHPPPSHHHPPPHQQQPHYHHPHASGTIPTPALVPVPAPGPAAHHPQSAFGPPPPGTVGHVSPPYNTSPTTAHAVMPIPGHPAAPPHGHPSHARPPHPAPHAAAAMHHYPPTHPPKEQLVSQFATLANRLGINLPSNLLSSLTESAGIVSQQQAGVGTDAAPPPNYSSVHGIPPPPLSSGRSSNGIKHSVAGVVDESLTGTQPATVASSTSAIFGGTPVAEALRRTADEAVAAVTRKRSHDDAGFEKRNSVQSVNSGEESMESKAAAYAKRRKKPRMVDCETRLSQLRAENETLKRHLDNVTNQSRKFEQDRIKAEETMKQMLASKDTPEEELNTVIHEYSEAYSDYGRRRHEELSFHLEQLQKLANPTNFTKMGLWTIAKANGSKDMSKQNPLVGILQKELGIGPQQVRKILEQRQKIRELCNNLNASLLLLQKLKELCEQKNKTFNDRMSKTREILSPKQVVKLVMWIKEHSTVLGNVCPGWTSEQVVKRRKNAVTTPETATGESESKKPAAEQAAPPSDTKED